MIARRSFGLAPAALLALGLSSPAAATLQVPDDYPSIAAGLAAAGAGDTVLVACGFYEEHGLQLPDGVTLRGEGGTAGCVVLSGGSEHRLMSGVGLGVETRIEGVTFRWGRADGEGEYGAALYLEDAHPTIRRCDFLNNAAGWGGAVAALDSRAVFEDCRFLDNRSTYYGGAVWCDQVAPVTFTRCEFRGNESGLGGGALSAYGVSHVMLAECRFRENESAAGAGLHAITASPLLDHCSFVDNVAADYGGAFALQGGDAFLVHCSFAGNAAPLGSALDYRSHEGGLPAIPNLSCCILAFNEGGAAVSCEPGDAFAWDTDIFGNAGGDWTGCLASLLGQWGNLSKDPQFCSHEDFVNLGLQSDSPCAAGACDGYLGAFPPACGEQSIQASDWGALKRRY